MEIDSQGFSPPQIEFKRFDAGSPEHAQALQLRAEVLRKPLGLAFHEGDLAGEEGCFHFGAFRQQELVGTLLLTPKSSSVIQMRQLAVHPSARGLAIGSRLVALAESFARERGYRSLIAHARMSAIAFYLKLGYVARGEPFIEVTIPHSLVVKELS